MKNIALSLDEHFKLLADEIHVEKGGTSLIKAGGQSFTLATPLRNCAQQGFSKTDFVKTEEQK
jgi:hypothetical protein